MSDKSQGYRRGDDSTVMLPYMIDIQYVPINFSPSPVFLQNAFAEQKQNTNTDL